MSDNSFDPMALAREVWPEAEGFLPCTRGWTFRVGGGYASITTSGVVAREPQGTRFDAVTFMPAPATTEEQPTEAGATVTPLDAGAPLPLPYCWKVNRPAPHREEGTFTISWGSSEVAPDGFTVEDAVTYVAAQTRIAHTEKGPLTIWIWQRREDEHYRMPPPPEAYQAELPSRHDDLSSCHSLLRRVHDRLDAQEAAGRLVDGPGCTPVRAYVDRDQEQ
jgi:hypothetical protein